MTRTKNKAKEKEKRKVFPQKKTRSEEFSFSAFFSFFAACLLAS